ncbi:MAG: hemolysin family protein [Rhodospirillaceae bacterium]|nr:hemolysin family protein [Rhodospirillaceae bacterium]
MNDPSSISPDGENQTTTSARREKNFWKSFIEWLSGRSGETARDTLEELIEGGEEGEQSLGADERMLLGNILELRGRTVEDVMVPRADIRAIRASATLKDFVALMVKEGHSRFPVYKSTLDNVLGMIHVKDVLANMQDDKGEFNPAAIVRPVMFVSPAMMVLDLLLEMRLKRCHMALVVDEFGGVDGLVTIEDLVEEIVGEIEDEFDIHEDLGLEQRKDGSWDASARTPIEALESALGKKIFSDEERDDIDTLGGLVFSISGKIPIRGELLSHPSGIEFEILDADARKVKRVRVRPPLELASEDTNQNENPDQDVGTWDDVEWAQELLKGEELSPKSENKKTTAK